MKQIAALFIGTMIIATSHQAGAEPVADPAVTASSPVRYSFGARAGGYGFRNTQHPDAGEWDDCRMDGLGLFGQRSFTRYLFAEVGFDLYTAKDAAPTADMPPGMDRISGITTVAGGARVPWRWVSPYIQLGVGLEVTRVEMPEHGLDQRAVLPVAFFGIGAELRATEHVSFGANVRTNLMKHYEHGGAAHDAGEPAHDQMTGELEAAAQGQLFLKYEI